MRKKLPTGRNIVNASEACVARSGGLVLASGIGDLVIDLKRPSMVQFDTEGKIHVYPRAVTQTQEKSSERVFTTLDRPAPMSPEMLAIYHMQRKNELEREWQRKEFEKRYEEQERRIRRKTKTTKEVVEGDSIESGSEKAADSEREVETSEIEDSSGRNASGENSATGAESAS